MVLWLILLCGILSLLKLRPMYLLFLTVHSMITIPFTTWNTIFIHYVQAISIEFHTGAKTAVGHVGNDVVVGPKRPNTVQRTCVWLSYYYVC